MNLVGETIDTVSFSVEAGKIREFARASHCADLAHVDSTVAADRGFASVLATATHVVVAGHHRDQARLVEKLGMDIRRIVVGSTSWEYVRPAQAGDALTGVRTVIDDVTKPTMRLVTLETVYVDSSAQVVVRQREVLIERQLA